VLASGLSVSQLVSTAWASASTFGGSDKRGGANGGRIRLRRRRTGTSTSRPSWRRSSRRWGIQSEFNKAQSGGKKISLADLIVLAGGAGSSRRRRVRSPVTVPFAPGRMDASAEHTDTESFAVLEPVADGFRNYLGHVPGIGRGTAGRSGAVADADRARMTVLVGGMRVLSTNFGGRSTASSPSARKR
jgi:catalase-peroxidase